MPLGSSRSARARGVFLFVLAGQHAAEQPVQDKPRWPRRSSERRTSHCVVPRTGDDFEASGLAEHWVVKGPSQPRGEGSHDLPALAPGRAAPPIVGRAEFPAHQGPPSRSNAATLPATEQTSVCIAKRTSLLAAYSNEPSSRVTVGVSASTVEALGMSRSRSSARFPIFEKSPSFCRAKGGGSWRR